MRSKILRSLVLLFVIGMLVAACAPTEAPTALPTIPPTNVPAPTSAPEPTIAPPSPSSGQAQPMEAPTPTAAPVPTNVPPTDVPAPTDAPTAAANDSGGLPQTVADAEGKVYTFQVVPDQTTVEYAVNEVLFGTQRITRGTTNAVEGDFKLGVKDGKPYFDFSKMRVDLRTLKSDNGMRDAAIQNRWLESNRYPYADFVVTLIEEFPAEASAGQDVKFKVTGDMTIREITKPVTFEVTVRLDGDTLVGTGVTQIFMKDFGFDPPEILGRFTVSDPATITVTGVAKYVSQGS